MTFTFSRDDFPTDFRFGAATAAYQIEGTSFGRVGSTHWDTFAAGPGNVVNGEDGRVACDCLLYTSDAADDYLTV